MIRRAALTLLCATAAHAQLDSLLAPVSHSESPTLASAKTAEAPRWLDPLPGSLAEATSLEAPALLAELEKQLSTQLTLAGSLKLELTRPWAPMKLPAPGFQVIIADLPSGGLSPSFYIRIKITSGGVTVVEGQLPLRAQLWQDVWVANARIERQQPLDRSLLAVQKTDILRVSQPLVPATVDPSSLEASQALPAGRPLTKRDVTFRPIIRKGQMVEVIGRQGFLNIRSKAMALENGATGDLIKLKNLESRREINAQILNESEVQIHF